MQIDLLTNEELIEQLQEEFEEDFFNELFNRFMPLYRKCLKKYPILDFEFDDYLQEGRIALLTVIENFNSNSNYYVASYFARVYENRLINYMRMMAAKKRENQTNALSLSEAISKNDNNEGSFTYEDIVFENFPDISDYIIAKDSLENLIKDLSDLEKEVLCRKMLEEDNSLSNIAKILGVNKRVVENAMARCRRKCKMHFRE